ncbi:MAG: DUF2461 domain-containing protein [Clostridia bacterium]|nr:DUF2461 domain-containing protein [Clostridia bacterium]
MFQGFSDKTVDFMWGIRFNNEKPWFEAHKEDYLTYFYNPMKDLNAQVYEAIHEKYPKLDLVHKVSRIYRDARRLRGRGPYKDRLWFSLERPSEDWSGDPVFWFELQPEGYTYGLGYYYARPVTMLKFRKRLDTDPKPFEKLVKKFNRQSAFVLDSEGYKKPKGDPGALLYDWYNSRGFSLTSEHKHDKLLYSPELADRLIDAYDSLMPFYQYLISLDSDPDPRGVVE